MLDHYMTPFAAVIFRVLITLIMGVPLVFVIRSSIQSLLEKGRVSRHVGIVLQKIFFFGGLVVVGVTILQELGFNVAALLGTAGIIGVAVGFASQTSISNIISGFFLLLERPFSLGDMISCNGITGVAESIDFLSVKIRTRDNTLIRLPNEMVLKSRLDTLTYYQKHCVELTVSVPYSTDASEIEEMVSTIVKSDDIFLIDPKPTVIFKQTDFPPFSNEIRLFLTVRVWARSENFRAARAELIKKIKQMCDAKQNIVTIT